VSEPGRARPNAGVISWLAAADEATLHLSVISLGEIRRGIAALRDPVQQARFEAFLATIKKRFAGRIHAIDHAVAERWGALTGGLGRTGILLPAIDSLIAATAMQHDLTVVTRNEADFHATGVPVLNPFS
jgi:predicted nucleic acid-binding protein